MDIEQTNKFIFLGNDPALDLLNTTPILAEGQVDLLATFEDLTRWLAAAGLISSADARDLRRQHASAPQRQAVLDRIKSFREALRLLISAVEAKDPVPKAALAVVNDLLRACPTRRQLAWRQEGFEVTTRGEDAGLFERVAAPLAQATINLLTARDLGSIRKCENPACVLHYYDTSKNHSRRWCSMEWCGNRMKAAKHYRRHRANPD
jgi:predicted RNA-binding Zn ribbon-like protein